MSRHETPQTVAEAVADVREAHAAMRKIRNNGGGTGATTGALARWQHVADRAVRYLLDAGERRIVGHLTEEADLAERVSRARAAGQDRPELQQRLVLTRRDLRRRVQHLAVA